MKLVTFNIRCDYGQDGSNCFCFRKPGILAAFARESAGERSVAVLNAGDEPRTLTLDWPWENCTDLLSGRNFAPVDGELHLALSPYEGLLLG